MKDWYNKLEPRERKFLIAGGTALIIAFLYFIMWQPFVKKLERLEKSTQEQQKLVTWMKARAVEVKQLRQASGPVANIPKGRSLLGVIDKTTKARRLDTAVKRVKPEGDSKARVWLESADFNAIIRWIEELQRQQGVKVVNAVVDRTKEPGKVDARIIFDSSS